MYALKSAANESHNVRKTHGMYVFMKGMGKQLQTECQQGKLVPLQCDDDILQLQCRGTVPLLSTSSSNPQHEVKTVFIIPSVGKSFLVHHFESLLIQKLEEEWRMKIQRENSMLMDKISHIMRTTGAVDNRNYYDKKSLGKEKRQLELIRITKENEMILLRLSQCRSHYNVRGWHEDWLQTLKVMDAIARYPRGASQQKGQDNPRKKSCSCKKEKKTCADETTHSPASTKTKGKEKSKGNESRKETSKKEDTGTEQEETTTNPAPKPNIPEKSISPDTPENPGSSDTIQVTPDKNPHTAERAMYPDGSEMPNTPHTPKTHEQETTSIKEG
ncbi:sperm axonemal maintenance protein CFAP97D1 [Scomber scombrus]|uniref:Sperm axonemal maintenance protein CFAP97D1 n=2 Tax=Scomber scombrus TaxID=13677 RepID=A0AAV1NL76_SCOSC